MYYSIPDAHAYDDVIYDDYISRNDDEDEGLDEEDAPEHCSFSDEDGTVLLEM